MLTDAYLPPSAEGTGASPGTVMSLLAHGGDRLREIPADRLLTAWSETVEAFLDPGSEESRTLCPALERTSGLSPQGLEAGLAAVLGGVRKPAAAEIFRQAAAKPRGSRRPALVVLAGNLPALAVQPLLPALALGRPVLLKSSSAEPFFAPTFLSALGRRLPAAGEALAALQWPGGDEGIEGPVLARAGKVLAYGESESIADLRRRSPCPVLGYGPRISLAVLGPGTDPEEASRGLARDVALFDQRGCLSVHGVYTVEDPRALARALGEALAERARARPPGRASLEAQAAARGEIESAHLRGLEVVELPLGEGAVIVEKDPRLRASPGMRLVRIHPLEGLDALPRLLEPWRDRLQGAALTHADGLRAPLSALGISRFAAPGELQSPDATWHNGGVHPLDALA